MKTNAAIILMLWPVLGQILVAQDKAFSISDTPQGEYTLKWLDQIQALDEIEITKLSKSEDVNSPSVQKKIDRTLLAFRRLKKYEHENGAAIKQEVVKLALTAFPSPDVNQNEWTQRVSGLGETWLPYLNSLLEREDSNVEFGIGRMLCYGVGKLHWERDAKAQAVEKLKVFLRSTRQSQILGVLIGIKESNISQLSEDVIPIVNGRNEFSRQIAAEVLLKIGDKETARKMQQALEKLEAEQGRAILDTPSVKAVEYTIGQLKEK